ncbi:hypothetical protein EV561_10377 [Rhizobium sp. BK376]|nr:hypothetical protein EV561_10377 [Rhizobium sp. BK376]
MTHQNAAGGMSRQPNDISILNRKRSGMGMQ